MRTAVITGASRGLGAGLARYFHEQGMGLALCARGAPALEEGERVLAMQLDVTEDGALERLALRAEERFGRIDLWINNAGLLAPIDLLRNVEVGELRRLLDVNVTGVFLGTRAYLRHLHRVHQSGVLVNISSGASTSPYEGWSAYCASKAAVDMLTRCAQLEEDGVVRAYAIAPGVIDTDMQVMIRATPRERFPMVDKFRELEAADAFSSTEHVARQLLAVAFDPSARPDDVVVRFPPGK